MKNLIILFSLILAFAINDSFSQCRSDFCGGGHRYKKVEASEGFIAGGTIMDNPQGDWSLVDFRMANYINLGDIKTSLRFRTMFEKGVEASGGFYYPITISENRVHRNFLILGSTYTLGKENYTDEVNLEYYLLDSLGNYQGKKIETKSFDASNKYGFVTVYGKTYVENFILSIESQLAAKCTSSTNTTSQPGAGYRFSLGYLIFDQKVKLEINYQKSCKIRSAQGLSAGLQVNLGAFTAMYNYNFKDQFNGLGIYLAIDMFSKDYKYSRYNEGRLAQMD